MGLEYCMELGTIVLGTGLLGAVLLAPELLGTISSQLLGKQPSRW